MIELVKDDARIVEFVTRRDVDGILRVNVDALARAESFHLSNFQVWGLD